MLLSMSTIDVTSADDVPVTVQPWKIIIRAIVSRLWFGEALTMPDRKDHRIGRLLQRQ